MALSIMASDAGGAACSPIQGSEHSDESKSVSLKPSENAHVVKLCYQMVCWALPLSEIWRLAK
eukprot:3222760-Amphidinium_carterae.1